MADEDPLGPLTDDQKTAITGLGPAAATSRLEIPSTLARSAIRAYVDTRISDKPFNKDADGYARSFLSQLGDIIERGDKPTIKVARYIVDDLYTRPGVSDDVKNVINKIVPRIAPTAPPPSRRGSEDPANGGRRRRRSTRTRRHRRRQRGRTNRRR
jgi:hypothetical protein